MAQALRTAPGRPLAKRRHARAEEALAGWLFILPAVIGFAVFFLWPLVRVLRLSLSDWNMLRPPRFIGLRNYMHILHDPQFWHSAWVTILYVLYNIPLQTVLGLAIAAMMDRMARSLLLRVIVIAPYLISNVVAAIIWLWMLDPLLGITNAFLRAIGVGPVGFLSNPGTAIMSVAGINIWRNVGFTALLFYAGLQAIPRSLYEAASLEGASEWRIFRHITLPLLRPVLVFVLVTSIIGSFQIFDTVAVATQGGPANATRVLVWYIYENAFRFFRMGYASALSVMLFLGLAAISLAQLRLLGAEKTDLD